MPISSTSPLALVTGASSGIGAATARAFSQAGYRVVLVARSQQKLDSVAGDLENSSWTYALDASDGNAVAAMATSVQDSIGVPDIIVNAAGLGAWKRMEETSPEEAKMMMDAPYLAAFNVSQAFLGAFLERESGVLIHIGSPSSLAPWPSSVGYAAARWALKGMHEALRADLHGSGVHTCHVVFGKVSSAYFKTNEFAEARIPGIGRIVPTISPEQCARVILRTSQRPRAEVLFPFQLRMTYWAYRVAPGLMRTLLRRTGYRPPTA